MTNGERINLMNAMIDKGKSILGKGNVGEAEMKAFEEKGDIEDVKNAQGLLAAFADKMTQDAFSEPVIAVQGLTQLGDIADASKTIKRDKATFIKMVDEITKQSGTNVVYFNAADLKESFGENEGDLKAMFNVTVSSFTRIASKMLGGKIGKCLTPEGSVMLLADVANDCIIEIIACNLE